MTDAPKPESEGRLTELEALPSEIESTDTPNYKPTTITLDPPSLTSLRVPPATSPGTYLVAGKRLPANPAAELLPLMPEDELNKLGEDIKKHGQKKPVYVDSDLTELVDGRNRSNACEAAGIDVKYEVLPPGTDLVPFVYSMNIARMHYHPGQRALLAAELANLRRGGDAGKPKAAPNGSAPSSLPKVSKENNGAETSAANTSGEPIVVEGEGRPVGGGDPAGTRNPPRARPRKSSDNAAEPQRPAKGTATSTQSLVSQPKAAGMMRISATTAKKAKHLLRDSILRPAVWKGTISVDAAYKARDADDETKKRLVAGERVSAADYTIPNSVVSAVVSVFPEGIGLAVGCSEEVRKSTEAKKYLSKEDALQPGVLSDDIGKRVDVLVTTPGNTMDPDLAEPLFAALRTKAVERACWLCPAKFEAPLIQKLLKRSTAFAVVNDTVRRGARSPYIAILFRIPAADVDKAVGRQGTVCTLYRRTQPVADETSGEAKAETLEPAQPAPEAEK